MAKKVNLYSPFEEIWMKIPKPFRNKFAITAALFFIWMVFFDKHDFFTQLSLQNSIEKMEKDKEFYTEKILEAKEDRIDLIKNADRFARERYYMSKPNEDVFVIEKPKD